MIAMSVSSNRAAPRWRRHPSQSLPIAPQTGPLAALRDKRILVIADGQNLVHGARDLGYRLSWEGLRQLIDAASKSASFHAVCSRNPGEFRFPAALQQQGWSPCVKTVRRIWRDGKWLRNANADNLLAFAAGALCQNVPADPVILGTGDGQLAEDVAEAIGMLHGACPVATLSLAGSTAARLDARHSSLISANIEIGRDCLLAI
jgi:hypothetical protein